jgi:ABC-2 type transport system ATP-binding protein
MNDHSATIVDGGSAGTPLAVDFHDVSKRYDADLALERASISIPLGQTVALLGPNGAGKSTTIGLMLGLLDPSAGAVRVLGLEPRVAVASGRVGAMLQTSGLPVGARVGELIAFVRRLYPQPLPAASILGRSGLEQLVHRPVETLSGGEAQRVRFAMAIAGDPDLVFLDEPTVAMDVESRRRFWAQIGAFAAEGRTVVFATHYLAEADTAADRIVVLDHGRIVADGSPGSIKAGVVGRVVRFRLPDPSAATLARIEALPAATTVETDGDRVTIRTTDSDAVIAGIYGAGLRVHDLEIAGVDLEDAFVALTAASEPAA